MAEYVYGAYGHMGETVAQSATQTGKVAVYVGTAPVNLVPGYKDADLVNMPVKLQTMTEGKRKIGYLDDWDSFTLCEPMAAHLDNANGNIGPIYVINVLDPDIHRKEEPTTRGLTFTNGRSEFPSSTIVLDSLLLGDKVRGVDFTVDYNFTKGTVVVSSADNDAPLTGTIQATYSEVDPDLIEPADIIGDVSAAGERSGLQALPLLYTEHNAVDNYLSCPGWNHIPAVYNAMAAACQYINGHWGATFTADLPLEDGQAVDTIEKAIVWKKANGYGNERGKSFWPHSIDNQGRIFHGSTLAIVEFMRADNSHNGVPMETCGNKEVPIMRQYFGPDSKNRGFDQEEANELTMNGISTVAKWGGRWVLWGDHTDAYTYGADVDPRAIFDVSIRMILYIINSFQREWGDVINKPMDRALKDRITNREQEKLDILVSMGALIGDPRVLFIAENNSTTDMMNGRFRWDFPVTPTPPLKAAEAYVAYTDTGFSVYYDEGGEAA